MHQPLLLSLPWCGQKGSGGTRAGSAGGKNLQERDLILQVLAEIVSLAMQGSGLPGFEGFRTDKGLTTLGLGIGALNLEAPSLCSFGP